MKHKYEVYYRDITDMSNHPFSKSYQEWISETFAANGSSVEFTEEKIMATIYLLTLKKPHFIQIKPILKYLSKFVCILKTNVFNLRYNYKQ